MKILFANHALALRSGSELATIELARAMRERNHQVAIFAMEHGALANTLRRQVDFPLFQIQDTEGVRRFDPDVVHSHHLSAALYLKELLPRPVRVHEMLGVLPALEAPPSSPDGFDLGIALSEEIAAAVQETAFGRVVRLELLRNWYDDQAFKLTHRPLPSGRLRAMVISNYVSPKLRRSLTALEQSGELTLTFIGGPRSRPITPALLAEADIVVSIGRTALVAGACGLACIVSDRDLSDGLLTQENLSDLRRSNFSGRARRIEPTIDHLRDQIAVARTSDRVGLAQHIRSEYSLSDRADRLLALYEALLAAPRVDRPFPPAEGHAFAEMAARAAVLQRRLDAVERLPFVGPPGRALVRLRRYMRERGYFR